MRFPADLPDTIQQPPSARIIDRSPVVGIDQTEIPYFIALINIGHARAGQFQKRLRQAVPQAKAGDTTSAKGTKSLRKRFSCSRSSNDFTNDETASSYVLVLIDPTGVLFGLADRLQHVGFDPIDEISSSRQFGRSTAPTATPHQSLIKQVFVIRGGRWLRRSTMRLMAAIEAPPFAHSKPPQCRHLRENIDPRAHILRTLRIMRAGRQHGVRPVAQALLIGEMKLRAS